MKNVIAVTKKLNFSALRGFWDLRLARASLACALLSAVAVLAAEGEFDLVIANGRVIDPATDLDAVRHVGIRGGTIAAVAVEPLRGRALVDATGLVVAPGFIDLHQHGQDAESYEFKALDGVTSVFELEIGTADVEAWYAQRSAGSLIHHGVSVGHIPVRMAVMGDRPAFVPGAGDRAAREPATEAQIDAMKRELDRGLDAGAVAVGFGMAYTAAAARWEILEMFRVAAKHGASCHVHIRSASEKGPDSIETLEEAIAAAAITGASLHVVHVQSSGRALTPRLLQIIGETKARGLDITTECYPYTAGMTDISAAIFDEDERNPDADFSRFQWPTTGERLTRESFLQYRKQGGLVIVHVNPEEIVRAAVAHPLTMIASDGITFQSGRGHPRNAGTYARVLGRYVRQERVLDLRSAIRKMTLMPAARIERRAPDMTRKGRIQPGADADLTVFDPEQVLDRATYENPAQSSVGIRFVLVAGVLVVKDGGLVRGVTPGRAIRARRL